MQGRRLCRRLSKPTIHPVHKDPEEDLVQASKESESLLEVQTPDFIDLITHSSAQYVFETADQKKKHTDGGGSLKKHIQLDKNEAN